MKAINDYIIIDRDKIEPKKIGGLLLTEDLDEDNRYLRATIISTGDLAKGLKDGDVIYYDKAAGHGITWENKLYYVIKARDVVIVE